MTRQEHLLTIAAEECAEVAQRISKAIRFTLQEIQPGQEMTNAQRILYEFTDLYAVMLMMHEEGMLPTVSSGHPLVDMSMAYKKKEKVEKFLKYSEEMGTITVPAMPIGDCTMIIGKPKYKPITEQFLLSLGWKKDGDSFLMDKTKFTIEINRDPMYEETIIYDGYGFYDGLRYSGPNLTESQYHVLNKLLKMHESIG